MKHNTSHNQSINKDLKTEKIFFRMSLNERETFEKYLKQNKTTKTDYCRAKVLDPILAQN